MTAEDMVRRIVIARGGSMLKVRGPSRASSITDIRHEAMWILRQATEMSYPEIAAFMWRRNHTTVISAVKKSQARVDADPGYGERLRTIAQASIKTQAEVLAEDVAILAAELSERRQRLRELVRGSKRAA